MGWGIECVWVEGGNPVLLNDGIHALGSDECRVVLHPTRSCPRRRLTRDVGRILETGAEWSSRVFEQVEGDRDQPKPGSNPLALHSTPPLADTADMILVR